MRQPETREFAHVVTTLCEYNNLSFMDLVVADKARCDLDLLDAALRWLVNQGHARYDTQDGVYNPEPSLHAFRDRLLTPTSLH